MKGHTTRRTDWKSFLLLASYLHRILKRTVHNTHEISETRTTWWWWWGGKRGGGHTPLPPWLWFCCWYACARSLRWTLPLALRFVRIWFGMVGRRPAVEAPLTGTWESAKTKCLPHYVRGPYWLTPFNRKNEPYADPSPPLSLSLSLCV